MKIKLLLFLAVLFASNNVFGSDIVGKWTEPALRFYRPTQTQLGGEDFEAIQIKPTTVEARPNRTIEFKKDGTGSFTDTIRFPEKKELKFTWILSGEKDSAERNVFIAFEEPLEKQKRPLLILSVKQNSLDQIIVSTIEKNSPLGDRVKDIKFEKIKNDK